MGAANDRRYSAPATLPFVLVDESRSTESTGHEVRALRFQVADAGMDGQTLHTVRIRGVPPHCLALLTILDAEQEAFTVGTVHDEAGRACTAGDMLDAMYGLDRQACLQVPAAEFRRPVRADHAVVLLRIRFLGAPFIDRVGVSADASPGGTPARH